MEAGPNGRLAEWSAEGAGKAAAAASIVRRSGAGVISRKYVGTSQRAQPLAVKQGGTAVFTVLDEMAHRGRFFAARWQTVRRKQR